MRRFTRCLSLGQSRIQSRYGWTREKRSQQRQWWQEAPSSAMSQELMFKRFPIVRLTFLIIIGFTVLVSCNRTPASQSAPAPKELMESTASTVTPSAPPQPAANSSTMAKSDPLPARPSGPIQFTDVSAQAGIRFKYNSGAFGKKYLPETMGPGVCAIDFDNDGWQDLLLVNSMDWPGHKAGKSFPALYHNNKNGTFTDVTRQAGLALEIYGLGCTVGDYDNDGFDDIYITALDGNHLFHNLGSGRFSDVTAKAGVRDGGFATGAVWFDYDNDGKLDLFVAHYVNWSIATDQFCSLDGKNKSY